MKQLYPSLNFIETQWSQPSEALLWRLAQNDASVPPELRRIIEQNADYVDIVNELRDSQPLKSDAQHTSFIPTSWMLDIIEKHVEVKAHPYRSFPYEGQIVVIEHLRGPSGEIPKDLAAPLVVFLDSSTETHDIWCGWLVSTEVAYASYWDYVLQEDDGVFDPLIASMVQLWNPVLLYVKTVERVTGEVTPLCLQAIRALATEYVSPSVNAESEVPQPGFIGMRETLHGHLVTTGTPLSGKNDPRWRYQEIYHQVAEAVRETARVTSQQTALPWWKGLLDMLERAVACLGMPCEPPLAVVTMSGEVATSDDWERIIDQRLSIAFRSANDSAQLCFQILNDSCVTLLITSVGHITWKSRLTPDYPKAAWSVNEAMMEQGFELEVLNDTGQTLYLIPIDKES